jgi:hypothetical protein
VLKGFSKKTLYFLGNFYIFLKLIKNLPSPTCRPGPTYRALAHLSASACLVEPDQVARSNRPATRRIHLSSPSRPSSGDCVAFVTAALNSGRSCRS